MRENDKSRMISRFFTERGILCKEEALEGKIRISFLDMLCFR